MCCGLLLRIREARRKKRHLVHPVVSIILLNGQFYKSYEDLSNCRGKLFTYFRKSIESFDKLLMLFLGKELLTKILDYACLCHHKRDWRNTKGRKYLFSHITALQISLSVRYTNTIEFTKFVQKNEKRN